VEGDQLGVRQQRDDATGVRAFVAEHRYSVGADVHVALERADAQVKSRAEGLEGVLGSQRSAAAMGLQVEAGSAQGVS
jgi:hypothetical protein